MEQGQQIVTVTPAARDLVVWTHTTLPLLSRLLNAKTGIQLSFGTQGQWAVTKLELILERDIPENDSVTGFLHDSLTIVSALLAHAVSVEREEAAERELALRYQRAGIKPLDHAKLDEVHHQVEQVQQFLRKPSVPGGLPADLMLGAQIAAAAVPVKLRTPSPRAESRAKKGARNAAAAATPTAHPTAKKAPLKVGSFTAPREFAEGINAVASEIERSLDAAHHDAQLVADPFSAPFLKGWSAIFEQGKALALHCHTRWRTMRLNQLPAKEFLGLLVDTVLPLFDDVYRCVQMIRSTAPANIQQTLRDLIEPTLALFRGVLGQAGLELLDPVGQSFNPEVHEAVDTVDAPHQAANIVEKVARVGFRMGSQLVRPAFVVVTRRGAA